MIKRVLSFIVLILVSVAMFVSCTDTSDSILSEDKPDAVVDTLRTSVLVYMMAENNLCGWAEKDIEEIYGAAYSVPNDCGLFVFIDDTDLPRLLQYRNKGGVVVCDTLHFFEEDFCSSDISSMKLVFSTLLQKVNIYEMNLIMWSHGDGWLKDRARLGYKRAIGFDNGVNSSSGSYKSEKSIEMDELAGFIESLPFNVEMLMFDACFMQCIEAVYDLHGSVDYILASPAEIPAPGAPYHKILPHFFADSLRVEDVMMAYYNYYPSNSGVLLSVVDCSKVQDFADATMPYIAKYFADDSEMYYDNIFSYLDGGYFYGYYSYPDFFDMNGVMMHTLSADEYIVWKDAFDKMVPFSCCADKWVSVYSYNGLYNTDKEQFCGVSMYLPRGGSNYERMNRDFESTAWYERVGWGAW